MKLIPMTDFVLEQSKILKNAPDAYNQYCKIVSYAKFLKQPLTLGMFIHCDEDGKPLGEPKFYNEWVSELEKDIQHDYDSLVMKNYQKSKEKVLFEGFEVKELPERLSFFKGDRCFITYSFTKRDFLGHKPTIKRVSNFGLTLTPNAIKQIEL